MENKQLEGQRRYNPLLSVKKVLRLQKQTDNVEILPTFLDHPLIHSQAAFNISFDLIGLSMY